MLDSFYHITHLNAFKTYFNTASALYISAKMSRCYSNVIKNDVICAPFVTTLLKQNGEAKLDIALVHLCVFRHCVQHSWTEGYVINNIKVNIGSTALERYATNVICVLILLYYNIFTCNGRLLAPYRLSVCFSPCCESGRAPTSIWEHPCLATL